MKQLIRTTTACLVLVSMAAVLDLTACRKKAVGGVESLPPVAVQVLQVKPASIARVLGYDADVEGEQEVRVFAQVSERIRSLLVDDGDHVKQGQVLAVLHAESLGEGVKSALAAVEAARAERDGLKRDLSRARGLQRKDIVSRAELDQLESRFTASAAQARRLQAQASQAATARGYAVVRSPIDGVIGRRYLARGDLATVALPIVSVVQMDRVIVPIEVPEKDLAFIRPNMRAVIRVTRHGPRPFTGTVSVLSPVIDRQTRTSRIKLKLENPEHLLMPGMLAHVDLEVERHERVVVVPYASLIIESGKKGEVVHRVFVVTKGRAEQRAVTIGIIQADNVEVVSGLRFGDQVVTQGQHLLELGRRVKVVERIPKDARRAPELRRPAGSQPASRPASARESSK